MKKTDNKRKTGKLIVVILLLAILGMISTGQLKRMIHKTDRTITVGVFSDSYWGVQNGYSYQIIDDAIRQFEAAHADIKVNYVSGIMKSDYPEWLSQQLLAKTAPDVFFVLGSDLGDLSQIGALKKLDTYIEKDPSLLPDDYYEPALHAGQYMGTQYAMPYECAPKLMFVNKTILDREGIDMPKENWTWEDFYRICQLVTKDTDGNGTIDQFGVTGYTWKNAFVENSVVLFDAEGKKCSLNDEKVVASIQFLERLNSLVSGYDVTAKEFDNGKVAFMPMSFSEYRAYKSYPLSIKKYAGFEWDCVEMPAGPSGDNCSELDTLLVGMNAETTQEKLAWDFIKILSGDARIQEEIFDYSEGVSVLKRVTESEETELVLEQDSGEHVNMSTKILHDVLEHAVTSPTFRGYEEAMDQVDRAVQSVMDDNKNISMDLIVKNREINKYLKNMQYYSE